MALPLSSYRYCHSANRRIYNAPQLVGSTAVFVPGASLTPHSFSREFDYPDCTPESKICQHCEFISDRVIIIN